MTFLEAAEYFRLKAIEVEAGMAEMALQGAEMIEKEAKSYLGTYQQSIGPYPGWVPLAESTQKARAAKGYRPDDPLLVTGELKDSIRSVLVGKGAVVGTNIPFAPDLEYGTSTIPPRPFLGRAAFVKKHEILELQKQILKAILSQ